MDWDVALASLANRQVDLQAVKVRVSIRVVVGYLNIYYRVVLS